MSINSFEQRIDNLSEFPIHTQAHQNIHNQNAAYIDQTRSINSLQQLMEIDEQSLVVKIGKLMHQLVKTKQKLFLYEDLCGKLRKQNEQMYVKVKDLQIKLNQNLNLIQQKIQIIQQKQQIIANIKKQRAKLTEELKKVEQKLVQSKIEKVSKVQQDERKYKKKLKQLNKINELLEKQLRVANSKIIQYERKMQDKDCTQYVMDMHRIRESSLKSTNTKFNENIQTRVKTQATPLKQAAYLSNPVLNRIRATSTKPYRH